MHIKQLVSFVTVARTKNMAQTALALNYSHSTIFGHLESLEKEYNTNLYCRTPHGIELTPKGELLLEYAKKILELYDESCAALLDVKQSTLRVGASESGDVCLMHEILRKFIHNYPSVEIEYAKMTSDVSVSKLIAGTCDVSIICEFDFHPEGLYSRYLGTLPLIFVTAPGYWKILQEQTPETLPPLLGTMKMPVAIQMLQSIGLQFDEQFSSLSNIGDLETIKQLLYYNRGVALLPKMYVKSDIQSKNLIQFPKILQECSLESFVVTPSKHKIGPLTKELIDLTFERYNPNHLTENNILS